MVKNSFELELVHSFNTFFTENRKLGFAYRLKQSTFNTQYVDIIVDSPDPNYYLAVECKSLTGDKLYFSSNFHKDKNDVHQIDNISGFIRYTGRRGFIAVEFRDSSSRKREAYLMPWEKLLEFFETEKGISIDEFRNYIPLERVSSRYIFPGLDC